MEILVYEGAFLVFDQCGIIPLQDGLIIDFSHEESVWDMRWQEMWYSHGPKHPDVG